MQHLHHEDVAPGATVTTRTVTTEDGARVHVVDHSPADHNEGLPTVVLAHGWGLDHSTWDRVVRGIQARHAVRVVTYDQPGHGRSTLGRGRRPSVRDLGATLRQVVAEVVPAGRLVLGGHSMGGMTVMAYAGAYPGELHRRTTGALLVATTPELASLRRPIPGEGMLMGLQAALPFAVPSVPMTPRMVRANVFGRSAHRADVAEVTRILNRTRARTTGRYFSALMGHDEIASLDMLVGIPTVVMAGERDRLTPAKWSRRYHERLPGAVLDVVEGAGHMLTYEATDRVVDHLEGLLIGTTPAPGATAPRGATT